MSSHAEMESVFAGESNHVLIDGNTPSFKSFGTQLLLLTGNEMDTERELIGGSIPSTDIVNADFGVGNWSGFS
jgi:hypothetical protein